MKYRTGYPAIQVRHSDHEKWKFISFAKELIYKKIIFNSEVKVKKRAMCCLMLLFQLKLLTKDLKNSLSSLVAQSSSINLPVP